MKTQQMPKWLASSLFSGLVIILALMPFHAFISTWGGVSVGPLWLWKSWKELLLVALVIPTLAWLITQPRVLRELIKKHLVQALLIYLAISAVVAVVYWRSNGVDAVSAGLAMNLRYLAVTALAYLLFCYGGVSKLWLAHAKHYVVGIGVLLALLGILQVLALPSDILTHFGYNKDTTIAPTSLIDNNLEQLRAFATLRGPNDFGAFLILPILLVAVSFRTFPGWVGVSTLAIMGLALFMSGSRSAWLGLIVALTTLGAIQLGKRLSRRQIGVGVVTLLFAAFLVLFAAVNIPVVRMAVFHSSPGDPSLTEGSTDNHIAATLGGIERVANNPLGCGIGCAGPASYYGSSPMISENYFVQIAEETGIEGLIAFIGLLSVVALSLLRARREVRFSRALLATLVGYVAIGLLLHVWADDPLSITWWMLAGAVLGYNERNTWIKSKTSSRSKTSSSS